MRHLLACFVLLTLTSTCQRKTATVDTDQPLYLGQTIDLSQTLTTIALGSCNRQDRPQKMWPIIASHEPQLWIWLGDNIYGDSEDMEVMRRKYLQQKYGEAYTAFRRQTPVIGIWDDHDFGANNAGKEFPKRDESQALMLDFLDVPPTAPVRRQKGGYQSFTFGPAGKQVKVILLDSRYFRDEPIRNPNRPPAYLPNEAGTILGEEQWAWLEKELAASGAQVHLIGNGIQVIPEDHDYEKWANFPRERQRLLDLLKKYHVPHPVLLSGDRHIAEISRLNLPDYVYPVYELTSSGMTHSYEGVGEEPNRHRVSDLIGKLNFGLIQIDWSRDQPRIELEVRGLENVLHTAVWVE
jgi:alkaline phosphatase D